MPSELKGYIFAVAYAAICVALAMVLYKFGVPKKYTRKVTHILVGFEWVILYHFMGTGIHFLLVCLGVTAILLLTHIKKLIPAMSSDAENAPGTVYYGVAMSVMAIIMQFLPEVAVPFGIGVFCTSFGDGFAGVVGQSVKRFNPKIFGKKSLLGSLANLAFSFGSAFIISEIYSFPLRWYHCLFIGILSVGLELIGGYGLDNILITVGTAMLAYGFVYSDWLMNVIIPIILTPFVIVLVKEKKALTSVGLAVAMVLDLIISITLGNFGFTLLLSFLALSIVIDKIKKLKKKSDTITKKGDCRDEIQVIANGLIPMVMALLYSSTGNHAFIVGYIAALAEAFGDTAGSGFGVFSRGTFDVFKMKKCECGISGGMSVVGTLSSLVGAILFSLIALAFGVADIFIVIIAAGAAFLGTVFDSFLGSVFQIKYRCKTCGMLVEREEHCGKRTVRESGFSFFDNDVVNLFSGAFAAILAALIYTLLI